MSDRRQAPREFTLVFPMAGRDAYSGYKYKPFMRLGEKTFIETAYESFVPWTGRIQRVVFACLREQEEQFDVRERLRKLFPDLVFDLIVLPEATAGPYATITQAVTLGDLSGPSVICDCDHALELSPFFDHIDRLDEVDCVLPTWSLRGENLKNWAVAAVDDEIGRVRAIAEKRIPQGAGTFVGVIGCYYFADLARLPGLDVGAEGRYVSDAIHALLRSSGVVHAVPIAKGALLRRPNPTPEGPSRDPNHARNDLLRHRWHCHRTPGHSTVRSAPRSAPRSGRENPRVDPLRLQYRPDHLTESLGRAAPSPVSGRCGGSIP